MIPLWVKLIFLLNLCRIYSSFNFFGNGGSWCPYQVDKYVSCQVRNGTETYYGPPICWKSLNGSFSCTKRLLYRPKFVKTYKKVKETKYKCCPAYFGNDCNLECFNCTSFQALQDKVHEMESRMNTYAIGRQVTLENEDKRTGVLQNEIVEDNNEDHEQLENAIAGVISNVRDVDVRVRTLEHKLARMMETVQQVAMTNIALKSMIENLVAASKAESHAHPQALPAAAENYYKPPHRYDHHNDNDRSSSAVSEKSVDQYPVFRILEQNLARGDIASTLNDDYGEENVSSSISPEDEYLDPFHLNDEGDPNDETMKIDQDHANTM